MHLARDLAACATAGELRAEVQDSLSVVFREVDAARVRALWDTCADALGGDPPRGGFHHGRGGAGRPPHLALPGSHGRRPRTDDVRGRLSREIERRARVVRVLPPKASPMRLAGARLLDADEALRERCRFDERSVLVAHAKPEEEVAGADDELRREAADVINSVPQPRL